MEMRWVVFLMACSRGAGEVGLGVAERPVTVDVSRLDTPEELLHALQLPGAALDKSLGAHGLEAKSTLKTEPPGRPSEELDESYRLDSDGKGAVHLTHDNARDGVEAVIAGGVVYVKPRYGHWTRRRPEGGDIERLRDNVEGVAAAYVELLSRWLVVKQVGRTDHTVRLALSARHSPESAPAQALPYKKWRDTVKVDHLDGEWTLDAASGAPIAGRLEASWSFERSDLKGPTTVRLKWEQHAATPEPIVAPADAVEPRRPRPQLDRDQLLDGLKTAH
jgi:hypothetical protein